MKIIVLLIVLINCKNANVKIKLTENSNENRKELLTIIPLNSDVDKVKQIMEEASFICEKKVKDAFLQYKNIDYLYCDLEKSKSFLIGERWQIAIVHKNNKVTEIYCSYGLIGP